MLLLFFISVPAHFQILSFPPHSLKPSRILKHDSRLIVLILNEKKNLCLETLLSKSLSFTKISMVLLYLQVLRQTTLPIVSERHHTFQRQSSHVLDMRTEIKFSICSLDKNYSNSKIGIIQVSSVRFSLWYKLGMGNSVLNCAIELLLVCELASYNLLLDE